MIFDLVCMYEANLVVEDIRGSNFDYEVCSGRPGEQEESCVAELFFHLL